MNPEISIMMPCFNNAEYLADAIKSVLDQQIECAIELVIYDDASTDASLTVAESFTDSHIRLVRGRRNRGIAGARNQLLRQARGRYLTSLDGDDLFLNPDKLQNEWNRLHESNRPWATIAYSDIQLIRGNGTHVIRSSQVAPPEEGRLFQALFDRRVMIPRDFLCHRDLYAEAGNFDEELPIYEDWDFKLRLARVGEFAYTGKVGVGYRKHGGGLSAAKQNIHDAVQQTIRRKYGTHAYQGDPMKSLRLSQRIHGRFVGARSAA